MNGLPPVRFDVDRDELSVWMVKLSNLKLGKSSKEFEEYEQDIFDEIRAHDDLESMKDDPLFRSYRDLDQSPAVPGANEPVTVTARINDSDGVIAAVIRYRRDTSGSPAAIYFLWAAISLIGFALYACFRLLRIDR